MDANAVLRTLLLAVVIGGVACDEDSSGPTEASDEEARAFAPPPMMPEPIPAGPDFDRLWLTMMIDRHQGAIDVSTLAHGSGLAGTLDSLAHHTIEEQEREQEEFADSLAVWYGGPLSRFCAFPSYATCFVRREPEPFSPGVGLGPAAALLIGAAASPSAENVVCVRGHAEP